MSQSEPGADVGVGDDVSAGERALRFLDGFALFVRDGFVFLGRGLEGLDQGILRCREEFEIAFGRADFVFREFLDQLVQPFSG